MKLMFWHGDRSIERVTGVYYQIGDGCEKLIKLLDAGWTFDGTSKPDPEPNNDAEIHLIQSTGFAYART